MEKEAKEGHKDSSPNKSAIRVLSILDFVLRILGAVGTLASAIAMGTTRETLSFTTNSLQFKAVYKDIPTFTFFVIANSVVCGYLVASLGLSFFNIVKVSAVKTRTVLIIFDMVMMALLTSGASSSAAIIYIAHNGNAGANWPAFCQQFDDFCTRISGSLIGSFVSVVVLMLITITISIVISFGKK